MAECSVCPRNCRVDRGERKGFCGCGENIRIAKYMAHFGEEPCITGTKGSGAVFFQLLPGNLRRILLVGSHQVIHRFGIQLIVIRDLPQLPGGSIRDIFVVFCHSRSM